MFLNDAPSFFQLLDEYFDIQDFPLFTRFRQTFEPYIERMFQNMVDFTEPICQLIDPFLVQINKTISDSAALEPILTDFLTQHPAAHPDTFLGGAAFDSADIYGLLLDCLGFRKALIPINPRNESSLKKVGYNEYGYPTCPNNPSRSMKYCGVTKEKGRSDRFKPMKTWNFACSQKSSGGHLPFMGKVSPKIWLLGHSRLSPES